MNLINLARMFELIELKSICENILNEREFLNPSVSSFLCDRNGGRLKELFLNSLDTSDVVFIVKGSVWSFLTKFTNFINNFVND